MPIEVKDLAGLSRPLTKLIETVEHGAGAISEPWRIVRRAKAEARADVIEAEAHVEIAELAARAAYRAQAREVRRQQNLEAIVQQTARCLPPAADETPVDPDWTAEFVNSAQDVSDEEMQSLWARILAGEVAQGDSFSRRTLAAVRVMSRQDAARFTRFCSFVWWIDKVPVCVRDPNVEDLLRDGGIAFGTLLILRVNGLITDEDVAKAYDLNPDREYTLRYFDAQLTGRVAGPNTADRQLLVTPLTPVGTELAPIAGAARNDAYFARCVAYFRANGLELSGVPE